MDSEEKCKVKKSNRTCFVPQCKTGYKSNPEKKTLFSVPRDPKQFEKWKVMIPRADKTLDKHHSVCEKHFKEECIERFYSHTIKGEEVLLKRSKPKLIEGALPTEYPDLPPIFSKKVPIKRKEPKCRQSLPSKIFKCEDEKPSSSNDENVQNPVHHINPKLPSQYWTKLLFKNDSHVFGFALWSGLDTNLNQSLTLNPERIVIVHVNDCILTYTVYISGCIVVKDKSFNSQADLETIINDVDSKTLCRGAGSVEEFSGLSCAGLQVLGTTLRHKSCKGYVDFESKLVCLHCKCARKQMLDRRCKQNKKMTSFQ